MPASIKITIVVVRASPARAAGAGAGIWTSKLVQASARPNASAAVLFLSQGFQ
jgi:hypothetical protein